MKSHRAFTLVELLATTALATLLMLVVLRILPALRRIAAPNANTAQADVVRLLRTDLINARRMQSNPDGVTLWGYCARDPATLAPTHRPATVVYRVDGFAGQSALLRLQTTEDGKPSCQLICSDITAMSMVSLQPGAAARQPVGDQFASGAGEPIGSSVRLTLQDRRGDAEQIICLR